MVITSKQKIAPLLNRYQPILWQQLEVRCSITNELLLYGGDPDDFPISIASYENSTGLVGYSND